MNDKWKNVSFGEFDMSYPTYSNYNYYYMPQGMYYSYWGYYPYHTNRGM